MTGDNAGWVVVIFEKEGAAVSTHGDNEVAYVKGPFATYEAAEDWAQKAEDCDDGRYQITFLEPVELG